MRRVAARPAKERNSQKIKGLQEYVSLWLCRKRNTLQFRAQPVSEVIARFIVTIYQLSQSPASASN